jgi:hypothetical protein
VAKLRLLISVLMLAIAAASTWLTVSELATRRRLRAELAEISHARYGLLNANAWVERVVPILSAKIDALDLTSVDPEALRRNIERILDKLIVNVVETMRANNSKDAGSVGGIPAQLRQFITNMLLDVKELRRHVPEYTNVVMAELGKPEAKAALQQYLKGVLADVSKTTRANVDMRWYSSILKQHGCTDGRGCQQALAARISEADTRILYDYVAVLLASAVAFALLLIRNPSRSRTGTMVLVVFCMLLLAGGLATPTIEIEAKISQLRFVLLGEPVLFTDQVLYFQSKTIIEVVDVLISQGKVDLFIVGGLVFVFSVVFPVLKLFASVLYGYGVKLSRGNGILTFFALRSSKWSMADVMVLALFMAFVGFKGLVSNSLVELQQSGKDLEVLTTNGTTLLPGCLLFTAFCVASLFLSSALERPAES